MIGNRSKNAIWNIIWGFINKITNIIVPFFVRTAIIYTLGAEYVGLNSLFTSILQILNLAELGISSAIVFSMYKPIAQDDAATICALMNLYKKLYRIIGAIVLIFGLLLLPFLKYLIRDTYTIDINFQLLYLVYLINTVLSYYVLGYKGALLNAHQKIGLISNVNSIICLIQNIVQIILLFIFHNYYLYIVIMPLATIINNIGIAALVNKMYPQYKPCGELSKEITNDIKRRVKGLLITRVCNTTRNAFNSIFISSFIGLTAVAIYSNYYYIMAALLSMLSIITNALTAGVANSMVLESVKKNHNDMRKFNFIYSWISGVCTVCMLCLYQHFMKLWVGDSMMYPMSMVIAFTMYFYTMTLGGIRAIYHDAAGLWWEARYRAIIEAVMNIVLNFILTSRFGAFGTVISTLISLIIVNYGYGSQIVFKYYFKGFKLRHYFRDHLLYTIIILISCIVTFYFINIIPGSGYLAFIFKAVVCFIIPNMIYFIAYRKNNLFIQSRDMFRRMIHNR